MVPEFNSIQKYYQEKNIILRDLRSIYARNNKLNTSNIIHTPYVLGLLKSSKDLLFSAKTSTKSM